MRDHPFYAALASEMEIRFSPQVPTAATNGELIVFHPTFFDDMPMDERLFVMIHELEHNANLHAHRYLNARDKGEKMNGKLWNMACDYAINGNMHKINKMKVPDHGLHEPAYEGWSAEEIYNTLYETAKQNKQPDGTSTVPVRTGNGEFGEKQIPPDDGEGQPNQVPASPDEHGADDVTNSLPDGIGTDPGELRRIEAKIKRLVQTSAISTAAQYKQQGRTPPREFKKSIGGQTDMDLPTRLKNAYITYAAKDNYSFQRPNRRYMNYGHMLPTAFSKKSNQIVIAIDNSGSIDEDQLSQFGAAATALMTEMNIHTLEILHCDTRVNLHETITQHDLPYTVTSQAGGGTQFDPVFERIAEEGWEPDLVMYFTDLQGHCSYGNQGQAFQEHWEYDEKDGWKEQWEAKELPYPVIWIYSPGQNAVPMPTPDFPMNREEFLAIAKEADSKIDQLNRDPNAHRYYYGAHHYRLEGRAPHVGTFMTLDPDDGELKV